MTWWPVALGIAVGIAYTLSPLSVLTAVGFVAVVWWAVRDVDAAERRWVVALLSVAIALRVLAVLALFLSAQHDTQPFRTFFGDEQAFLFRSIWRRNLALGIPIHRADTVYAFDQSSPTIVVEGAAVLQMFVGLAPYGLHLVSILCFVCATVVLYRLARRSFGPLPALLGLALLLFLPSLFAWSIAVLKEPAYWLFLCVGLAAATRAASDGPWPVRAAALALVPLTAIAAESVRHGGLATGLVGGVGGFLFGAAARRPRVAMAAGLVAVTVVGVAATLGPVEDRVVVQVRRAAAAHWQVVNTPGYVYTVLDDDFYRDRGAVRTMSLRQGLQFIVGAAGHYVVEPVPWHIRSAAALMYLPEQVVWYVLLLLAPIGFVVAIRRDASLTLVLSAYAASTSAIVAVTSGNIGTLVRHRGLAIPYIVWFSVLGGCCAVARWSPLRERDVDCP